MTSPSIFNIKSTPAVRLVVTDIELQQRAERAGTVFSTPEFDSPSGIEFTFVSLSAAGSEVVQGKLSVIAGRQVNLQYIETRPNVRRCGHAAATVLAIIQRFGLPVVPVDERGAGIAFFETMRRWPVTAAHMRPQISVAQAWAMGDEEARARGL